MDEVADPAMSILAEGLFDGPKSYIFKIEIISLIFPLVIRKINNITTLSNISYNNTMFHTRVRTKYNYSTLIDTKLKPYFVTGFCDGESCFYIKISKNSRYNLGWTVEIGFTIVLHKKKILELIQLSLEGIGSISSKGKDAVQLRIRSFFDLIILLNHFDNFPLISQKFADYLLFKEAFSIYSNSEHLKTEGLKKLVAIKGSINKGLSDELKKAFPDVKPVPRPLVLNQTIKDPNWLSGFISGEGLGVFLLT